MEIKFNPLRLFFGCYYLFHNFVEASSANENYPFLTGQPMFFLFHAFVSLIVFRLMLVFDWTLLMSSMILELFEQRLPILLHLNRLGILIAIIFCNETTSYTLFPIPVGVALLVSANTEKCGPSKWHMVLGSNPATNDTLNLPGVGCCGVVSIPRFGSPWRVLRA